MYYDKSCCSSLPLLVNELLTITLNYGASLEILPEGIDGKEEQPYYFKGVDSTAVLEGNIEEKRSELCLQHEEPLHRYYSLKYLSTKESKFAM